MNNRNPGRRRGRGTRQTNRGPNTANQNRGPGNAKQLCDKYRNMASDAHQQGDRVMNEYYLQFADHYFRVLAEHSNRKDDQQQQGKQSGQSDQQSGQQGNQQNNDGGQDRKPKPRQSKPKTDDDTKSSDTSDSGDDTPKKRAPRKAVAKDSGNGKDEQTIEADRLPASLSLGSSDGDEKGEQLNGKTAKKAPTRAKPKTADDGDNAEGKSATA